MAVGEARLGKGSSSRNRSYAVAVIVEERPSPQPSLAGEQVQQFAAEL